MGLKSKKKTTEQVLLASKERRSIFSKLRDSIMVSNDEINTRATDVQEIIKVLENENSLLKAEHLNNSNIISELDKLVGISEA